MTWFGLCGGEVTQSSVTALLQRGAEHLRNSVPASPKSLLIFYGGHGNQVRDIDGDESDGLDECWVLQGGGIILDDVLTDMLAGAPPSATFVVVSDSCSSGTMIDSCRWKNKQQARWAAFSSCRDNQDALSSSEGGVFTTWGFLGALEAAARTKPTPAQVCDFIRQNVQLDTQTFRYEGNYPVGAALFA